MDHHVDRRITRGLRSRGVDVLAAEEDGAKELPDDELLVSNAAWPNSCDNG